LVLACSKDRLSQADAQVCDLPELPRDRALGYSLKIGDTFCVHVRNASLRRLRVTLVNCAASGKVEFLGDQVIDPRSFYRFWLDNVPGSPFEASEVEGSRRYIDRLVVIGTTRLDKDLKYLGNHVRFSEILSHAREMAASVPPPVEEWTATEVLVRVGITEHATS
jgi:hypothetical protein